MFHCISYRIGPSRLDMVWVVESEDYTNINILGLAMTGLTFLYIIAASYDFRLRWSFIIFCRFVSWVIRKFRQICGIIIPYTRTWLEKCFLSAVTFLTRYLNVRFQPHKYDYVPSKHSTSCINYCRVKFGGSNSM